jgi:delta14-sterol reductase
MLLDMDLGVLLPSLQSVYVLVFYFVYLAVAGEILPGKVIRGVLLSDGSQLRYRCNGLLALILLVAILGICAKLGIVSPLVVADRGLELLSATFIFCVLVTLALYVTGRSSSNKGSSLKPHVSGNLVHDWWFGIQLNPQFMSIDLK